MDRGARAAITPTSAYRFSTHPQILMTIRLEMSTLFRTAEPLNLSILVVILRHVDVNANAIPNN